MTGKGGRHPTERAALFGKRLVVAIETEEGARLGETQVKELTGSDPITARRMHEDFWTFNPTHKVWLCTNHKPEVRGTDHAIWRRLKLVPFGHTITDDKAVKDMPRQLRQELSGILAWCVRGGRKWQSEGRITAPDVVEKSTQEYRDAEDVLGAFLAEHCDVDPTVSALRAKSSALYSRYLEFSGGSKPSEILSKKAFAQALKDRGFGHLRNNGVWYTGLRLREKSEGRETFYKLIVLI